MEKDENNTIDSTPMGRVWKVVIASMLFTALAGFIWHRMTLTKQERYNTNESEQLTSEIVKLTAYRDYLREASTSQKKSPL